MKKISYFAMFVAVVTLFASCAKTELAETQTGTQPSGFEAVKSWAGNRLVKNTDKKNSIVLNNEVYAGNYYLLYNKAGTASQYLFVEDALANSSKTKVEYDKAVVTDENSITCSGSGNECCISIFEDGVIILLK